MISAAIQRTDEIDGILAKEIKSRMEADTAARFRRASIPEKGFSLAAGRDLAKRLAASRLQVPAESIRLAHKEDGKPYIKVRDGDVFRVSPLKVSLSHSDTVLLAAVSEEEVACEIQTVRHVPLQVLGGWFSDADIRFIGAARDPDEVAAMLWCRRGCMVKLLGKEHFPGGFVLRDPEEIRRGYGISFFEKNVGNGTFYAFAWYEANREEHVNDCNGDSGNGIDWREI